MIAPPCHRYQVDGKSLATPSAPANPQPLKVPAPEQAQDRPLRRGEGGQPARGGQRLDRVDRVLPAPPDDRAPARREHILVPVHVGPVGELDHEAALHRGHDDRGLVELATAAPDVPDEAERPDPGPGQPAGQGVQRMLEHDEQAPPELLNQAHLPPPLVYTPLTSYPAFPTLRELGS